MINWRQYWEDFPLRFDESDFERQVGRTAHGGVPTPEAELSLVTEEIVDCLELSPRDRLLDLCCGNGLLSAKLATRCASVIGFDFSAPMIRIARKHHAPPSVDYVEGSVLELDTVLDPPFDKVCMIESLAYFGPEHLGRILDGVSRVGTRQVTALFSGVLDADSMWSFFDTAERRAAYEKQKREGREIMGRWWERDEIASIAERHGYQATFTRQDARLNTAHYRFNVVMRRR